MSIRAPSTGSALYGSFKVSDLSLIQLDPDREAFGRWATLQERRLGLKPTSDAPDAGYAWHALLTAAFGNLAPRPFVDRHSLRSNFLLGYSMVNPAQLQAKPELDELANRALALDRMKMTQMPQDWRAGQILSFEVRCRPIVRTRHFAKSGKIDEMDAAVHAAIDNPEAKRDQVYAGWLERELGRENACQLEQVQMASFRRTRILRRNQGGERSPKLIEGPEAWMVGRLVINQPAAFTALLSRGLGRHRAFGFGCLIVAQPAVLD